MANGADQSIDPKVAPQGAIARVQDFRIDQRGRLVPRRGYTALGTSVHQGGTGLVPFDLHAIDGELVCLGNNAPAQTGIRAPYILMDNAQGTWRTETGRFAADNTSKLMQLPACDRLEVLVNDPNPVEVDSCVASVAISDDGRWTCMVSTDIGIFSEFGRVTVFDNVADKVAFTSDLQVGTFSEARVQVVALNNNLFKIFAQDIGTTNVQAHDLDMSALNPLVSQPGVIVLAGVGAFPVRYDVCRFEGTSDYLIAGATGAGYSWARYTSANATVCTGLAADAAVAGQPLCIQGRTGETVNVVACRNTTQVSLRTFNSTTGALLVGPTLAGSAELFSWVSINRLSAAVMYVRAMRELLAAAPRRTTEQFQFTTAAHVTNFAQECKGTRPACRPFTIDGEWFTIETLGMDDPAPYGIVHVSTNDDNNEGSLHGVFFDGIAKTTFAANTSAHVAHVGVRAGTKQCYAALITKDPRDKTFRTSLVRFEVWSGRRRQGVAVAGQLYLTGGLIEAYDKRLPGQVGSEITPVVRELTSATSGGGALTALGVYQVQVVFRYVSANGEVTQSPPSPPATRTLVGADNSISFRIQKPYSDRINGYAKLIVPQVFVDVYRTEAGGSIPRLVKSQALTALTDFGDFSQLTTEESDSVAQAGVPLYTQGADGSISGRLPLGLAASAELIAESDGKVILARTERINELTLSVEKRPGEAVSFVNDDIFYVSNPDPITALVSAEDGRRFIFSRDRIRELVGPGPNAAGVGDISSPVEIETRVGCGDWRSVCKTEHGIFFRTGSTDRPGIYMLPRGGSQAVEVSSGIDYLLAGFPVITSATRHEEEQLLTFTLQNLAGTDGRIVHLDLKMSGQDPKRGWVGAWIVDRVALFEGIPDIEIVSQEQQVFPFVEANPGVVDIRLPKGRRVGDRMIIILSSGNVSTPSSATGWTVVATPVSSSGSGRVLERLITTPAIAQVQTASVFANQASLGVSVGLIATVLLLRNTHPSSPCEGLASVAAATVNFFTQSVTPTWGAAKNLWIAYGHVDSGFFNNTTATAGPLRPRLPNPPLGFENLHSESTSESVADSVISTSVATRLNDAANQPVAQFTASSATNGWTVMLAIRPRVAVANASPLRASVQWRDQLVVCNSARVFKADRDAFSDDGVVITPEWESCDIYPMGVGGEGRHLSVLLFAEVLDFCDITCWYSYDNAQTWVRGVTYQVTAAFGYAVGQSIRLIWTPYRRKIQGVRIKFTMQDSIVTPLGTTRLLALHQAIMTFEDIAGPSRLTAKDRGNTGL